MSKRICKFRLRVKLFIYSIISIHASTEEKSEEEKDTFYEEVKHVVRECPKNDIKIIIGDFNAKIGHEKESSPMIEKFSLHKESNMRMENV